MFNFFKKLIGPVKTGPSLDDIEKLRKHPAFNELSNIGYNQLQRMRIEDPIKQKMTICYMELLAQHILVVVYDIVKAYENGTYSTFDVTIAVNEEIRKFRDDAVSHSIPPLFVNKFASVITPKVNITTCTITELRQTGSHKDDYSEISSIMDILVVFMRLVLDTLETTVNTMNGELKHALEGSVFDTIQ